jgi:large subunit ribosomal protein L17
MYHAKGYRKLGRDSDHRRAMLRNLATSFLREGRITTTVTRAKEVRRVVERIITRGKAATLASRRHVGEYLFDNTVAKKVVSELAGRFKTRNGGYTRIVKLGERHGDGAFMCNLELVDYREEEGKRKAEAKTTAVAK